MWMSLETLCQEKDVIFKRSNILGFRVYEVPRIGKSIYRESGLLVAKGLMGTGLPFGVMKMS